MVDFEVIYGMHSIAEVIKNPSRSGLELFCTNDSFNDLKKMHFSDNSFPTSVIITKRQPHALQEESKVFIRELGFKESRVPSNIFLVADRNELLDVAALYDEIESASGIKILALDQVTDVHNLAAIIRTACFYGIKYVAFSKKGQASFPPNFFRIASGGSEHVNLINCSSMSKFIHKLNERGVSCVGLSEHATSETFPDNSKICFVMGSEDTGLSNATNRVIEQFVSLKPVGEIKSLNVSVAAAVAIEKFWSN